MKTILYNPMFINPQAYYVFPRLTRWLRPDDSYKEPANYIGQIEVTIIAYGEIGYTEYFEHTNYIDFTNFSNSYVRISLFTRLGSCVLGEWKIGTMEGDRPYIEPEVLASLKAVVIVGDKTNQDKDRDIVANLVDASNPFIISNAAYEGMSGYNGYPVVFGSNKTWETLSSVYSYTSDVTSTTIHITRVKNAGTGLLFSYVKKDGALTNIREIPAFRVTVKGLEGNSKFGYRYLATEDATGETLVYLGNGTHELSKSFTPTEALLDLTRNAWVGIFITPMVEDEVVFDCDITIEILPEYEGAFVTDGIDDLITSTKTVQEMLGGSNELTIVSMVHQVKDSANNVSFTNYIRGSANGYFRNIVNNYDKTGIYGYTSSDLKGLSVVNNILGDKNDYTSNGDNRDSIINGNFSVQGYSYNDGNNTGDFSSVAWYWTIIANKVLTTDQINQVIDYFNLDRTLNPDILCNTIKQGITNENHAEFGDKLIDFSGNGRDIQLNNLAWKGGSGIAAKQYETFKDWTNTPYQTSTVTEIDEFTRVVDSTSNAYWVSMINRTSDFDKVHDSINIVLYQDDMLLVHECKYKIDENVTTKALYETLKSGVNTITLATIDKFTDIPEDAEIMSLGEWVNPKSNKGSVKITLLPSYEGGVLLDGINDFGKVTGMPIYKDYTFIIDYERISYASSERWVAGVVSKSHVANQGAFILMTANTTVEPGKQAYSFGGVTSFNRDDFTRALVYQSKYKCGDVDLTVGEGVDSNTLWLGTFRDNDQRFFNGAIYSLMSFPYSMSEFLIDRQLKKHKLGTLYPDMVEWRPIIKSNVEYASISYLLRIPGQGTVTPVIGQYYPILSTDTSLVVYVATNGVDEVANLTINGQEPTSSSIHVDGRFKFEFPFNNSPQKINITIDEYIRYEDIDFTNCYPGVPHIYVNDKSVTWGDKLKVGDEFTFYGNVNILPEMYNVLVKALYNGEEMVYGSIGTISKSMVFTSFKTYIFDDNEPKCILSPRLLSIPNSSYKILGYIPDISGHGNNGVIHNSAYTEGSGVNEDGSYQFDGVDDFVTIPTVTGGKQVLMKVNWQSDVGAVTLYDQRLNISDYEFAIYNGTRDLDDNPVMAYQGRNNGQTYIDGILNSNIMASELKAITHNITITNELSLGINNTYPVIGSTKSNTHFAQMSLYDFMLFDEISTDEEILTLNEYVGIEGNTDDLFN